MRAPLGPLDYLRQNFWLRIDQQGIANTLKGVPFGPAWNGSLWSLFYEFICYLMLAVFALSRLLRHRRLVAILAAAAWGAELIITWNMSLNAQVNIFNATDATRLLQLVPIFLFGTLLYLYRDKVPDSFWLAAASAILVALSFVIPLDGRDREFGLTLTNVFAPALAYLMIWLGIHLPLYKVGARNDYSYGIYIYGYPVTQLLAVWGVYRWGVVGYTSCVVVVTTLFAVGSWWLIEKNVLRLKKVGLTRPPGPRTRLPIDLYQSEQSGHHRAFKRDHVSTTNWIADRLGVTTSPVSLRADMTSGRRSATTQRWAGRSSSPRTISKRQTPMPTGSCSISRGRIVADGTAAEVKALASGRTMRATLAGADEDGIAADLGGRFKGGPASGPRGHAVRCFTGPSADRRTLCRRSTATPLPMATEWNQVLEHLARDQGILERQGSDDLHSRVIGATDRSEVR